MLHDKATTSQPLGRCFDSRWGEQGQPSAPLPVLAAERIPEHGETRLRTGPTPCSLRAPLWVILRGASQRFSATPSKRDVLGAGATVGEGERRQWFAHGPDVESECVWEVFCWRGFSVSFLIPPHHLRERRRNFTSNRTCSVFHRTSAWLLRSP